MLVEIKLAYNCLEKIKELFKEYTDMLVKEDEKFAKYLKMQDYDLELENLQIKYGIPGRIKPKNLFLFLERNICNKTIKINNIIPEIVSNNTYI